MTRVPITAFIAAFLLTTLAASEVHAQTAGDVYRFSQRSPITGARIMGALNTFSTVDEASGFSEPIDSDIRDTGLLNLGYVYKMPTTRGSLVFGAAFSRVNTFDRNFAFRGMNDRNTITTHFLPFANEFEVEQDDQGYYPVFANTQHGRLAELAYLGGAIEFLPENVDTGDPLFDQAVLPGFATEQRGDIIEEGNMNEASVGAAVEAAKGVMIGGSVNLAFGTYRFDSEYREIDVANADADQPYIVRPSAGEEFVGFDELVYTTLFESELVGVNARLGLASEVAPGVRVGLTIETPTFYSVNEDYSESITTFFDDGESLSYGTEPGDFTHGTFEYEVITPWRLGAGLAYRLGNLLTVTGDLEFVDWSQLYYWDEFDTEAISDANLRIREGFEAVVNTRLGAELQLFGVALRAGWAYQPSPYSVELVHQLEHAPRPPPSPRSRRRRRSR